MTIAHACWLTGHCKLDRATETTYIVSFWTTHIAFFVERQRFTLARGLAGGQPHINEFGGFPYREKAYPIVVGPN